MTSHSGCNVAGTLTQNKMAVSRLWLAGQEVQVDALGARSPGSNGALPAGLDPGALSVLLEGIALNSTAELRDTNSEHRAPSTAPHCNEISGACSASPV